jgi:hypothetical protein
MKGEIRKISVGKDYPDGVLHYQVGKIINLAGTPYEVTNIIIDANILEKQGKAIYNIYIANPKGKVLWKTIVDVPVVIEYNINFE